MNPSLLNIIWLSVQSAYVFSYLSYAVSYLTSFAVASVMDIDIDIKLYIQNIYDLCDGPGGGGWALQCNKCLCWPTLCNCASISQQTRVRRQPRHGALHVAAAGGGGAAPAHTPPPASLFVVYCWTAQWSGDSWAADWARCQRNFAVIFTIFGEGALQVPSPYWKCPLALSLVIIYIMTLFYTSLSTWNWDDYQLSSKILIDEHFVKNLDYLAIDPSMKIFVDKHPNALNVRWRNCD